MGRLMRYAALTTVGATRHENQDAVVVGRTLSIGAERVVIEGELTPTPGGAFVAVVDGMGGHRGGREAAATVGRYLLSRGRLHVNSIGPAGPAGTGAGAPEASDNVRAVYEMLVAANCLLYDEMAHHPDLRAMGATIAGLACFPGSTVLFNLGDARAYHFADGYLQRISQDHRAPSGTLLQSLGGTIEPVALAPFVQTVPEQPGRRWLLCSDGLSDFLPFLAMQEMLGRDDQASVVRGLVGAALDAGSNDNVSAVLLDT